MKKKRVKAVEVDENGDYTFNLGADGANIDGIRAARLQRKADAGDAEAAAELRRLQAESTYELEEDDE